MPQNWWEMYPEVVPSPAARPGELPGPGGVMPRPAMAPQAGLPNAAVDPLQGPPSAFDPSYFGGDVIPDPASPQAQFSGDGRAPPIERGTAILHAAAAIQRGADPDAVRARLYEMGHADPNPPSPFSDLIPDGRQARGMTGASAVAMPAEARPSGWDRGDFDETLDLAAIPQQNGSNLQRRSDPMTAPQKTDGPSKYFQSKAGSQATDRAAALGHAVPGLVNRTALPNANAAGLNGYGYVPQRGDENLLARFLYSEFSRSDNWRDMPAGAWTAINRIRPNGHWPRYRTMDTIGTSLLDVLNKRGRNRTPQYSWVPPGGIGAPGGSPQWQESARPETLTGRNRQAWMWAVDTARRVLGGVDADRTGGATHFYNISVGNPHTVGGFFGAATRGPRPTLTNSPYRSPNGQNFFLRTVEDTLRPIPWRASPPQRR